MHSLDGTSVALHVFYHNIVKLKIVKFYFIANQSDHLFVCLCYKI